VREVAITLCPGESLRLPVDDDSQGRTRSHVPKKIAANPPELAPSLPPIATTFLVLGRSVAPNVSHHFPDFGTNRYILASPFIPTEHLLGRCKRTRIPPPKVLVLFRREDRIQAFSSNDVPVLAPAEVLANQNNASIVPSRLTKHLHPIPSCLQPVGGGHGLCGQE
jgi:hypothetical protein